MKERTRANHQPQEATSKRRGIPTVSHTLDDGTLVELLYDARERKTSFAIWDGNTWNVEQNYSLDPGPLVVPYSPENNLIKHQVILFPEKPEEYGTKQELLNHIQTFIHRYVDLSPVFEIITTYYVLLSWVYDRFNELPYLRVRGDYGSGKTRFLLVVGSLCYKGAFASGASSVSPIFHILDSFRGTLVMDESDFRFSDEKAEIVKILNNGNVKGFPVLRCEVNRYKEFNPRAFNVYGPKVLATRGHYDDKALESRFLTEDMGQGPLRKDIPISLPSSWEEEARSIRNKLLLYRFRHYAKASIGSTAMDPSLEPRINQIYRPLLAVVDDTEARHMLLHFARTKHREAVLDRSMEIEAEILSMVRELSRERGSPHISIKHIADRLNQKHGLDYDRAITPKWIGTIVRQKLHLKTYKRHGAFVVAVNEKTLEPLYEKYGIRDDDDALFLSRGAPDDSLALPIGGRGDLGTLGEGRWPRDSIETKAP